MKSSVGGNASYANNKHFTAERKVLWLLWSSSEVGAEFCFWERRDCLSFFVIKHQVMWIRPSSGIDTFDHRVENDEKFWVDWFSFDVIEDASKFYFLHERFTFHSSKQKQQKLKKHHRGRETTIAMIKIACECLENLTTLRSWTFRNQRSLSNANDIKIVFEEFTLMNETLASSERKKFFTCRLESNEILAAENSKIEANFTTCLFIFLIVFINFHFNLLEVFYNLTITADITDLILT